MSRRERAGLAKRPVHIERKFPELVSAALLKALTRAGRAGLLGDELLLALHVIRGMGSFAAMGVMDVDHRIGRAQEVDRAFALMHQFIQHPERYVAQGVAAVVMAEAGSRGGVRRAQGSDATDQSVVRKKIKDALIRADYKTASDKATIKHRIASNLACSVRLVEKVAKDAGLTRAKASTSRRIAR